jgi:hypothetical protein
MNSVSSCAADGTDSTLKMWAYLSAIVGERQACDAKSSPSWRA